MRLLFIFLLISTLSYSQSKPPKKANTIEVSGVTFKEVANGLMDAGYTLEKVDSNFLTIKTDFKQGTGKTKWMKMRFHVRVKDSTAIITGDWYNDMLVGSDFLGREFNLDNLIDKIENASVNPKNCFNDMNAFALSFNKPVQYFIR